MTSALGLSPALNCCSGTSITHSARLGLDRHSRAISCQGLCHREMEIMHQLCTYAPARAIPQALVTTPSTLKDLCYTESKGKIQLLFVGFLQVIWRATYEVYIFKHITSFCWEDFIPCSLLPLFSGKQQQLGCIIIVLWQLDKTLQGLSVQNIFRFIKYNCVGHARKQAFYVALDGSCWPVYKCLPNHPHIIFLCAEM